MELTRITITLAQLADLFSECDGFLFRRASAAGGRLAIQASEGAEHLPEPVAGAGHSEVLEAELPTFAAELGNHRVFAHREL